LSITESFSRGRGGIGTCTGELDRDKLASHCASTADRHSRAQSETREIKHRQRCLTSRWSSGRLSAVSGELDGWERGRGSPAASGGVGRARESAMLCEMWRGSECGHWRGSKKGVGCMGGRRGREIRRRVRVCKRWSTASVGRAELTRRFTAQREKRGRAGNGSAPGETEREEGHALVKQHAPTGRPQRAESKRERERERERERAGEEAAADRRGLPVRRRWRRSRGLAGPSWPARLVCVFPFLWIF
jgi:hypothetical protein